MKKLFLSLVAMMVATVSYSQNTTVATLSHGGEITMYYGLNALREAHEAAESGDIISLSGGTFNSVNITKAITLRGAGIDRVTPTFIVNEFEINVTDTETAHLSVEGIRCASRITMLGSFSNASFLKCQFNTFWVRSENIKDMLFVDCKITNRYQHIWGTHTVQFVNCYVADFQNSGCSASFVNCVNIMGQFPNSQLTNCIIYNPTDSEIKLNSSSLAQNCVIIGNNNSSFLSNSTISTGCKTATYAETFKSFTGTYTDDQTFELTDNAKTKFLGTDGKQVGMYGGMMPFNTTTSYPQITKLNVANKTTADGKLSVEIEVSAGQ